MICVLIAKAENVLLFGENAIGGFPLLASPSLARRRDRREEGREYSMPTELRNVTDMADISV